ncbi:MAG: FMN-binding negative transcriptional regulator [Roseobacter sp.]
MHPNPVYHSKSTTQNIAYARERAFGVLALNSQDAGPLLSHVPFVLDKDGDALWLHLVRSNPMVRLLKAPCAAKIAVSGPDSYVSPDWYGAPDQVPTWNYVAVHLSGMLELCPQADLRALLDRQSAHFEGRLSPKLPWTTDKMTEGVLDRMMRSIVPCRMKVEKIDGTWKLNQNKPDDVRHSAASQIARDGLGSEIEILASLMRAADGQG